MTFDERCLSSLKRERERVIASSIPKPTLWSAKIMGIKSWVYKTFLHEGVQHLGIHRPCAWDMHRPHAWEVHKTCTGYMHENRMGRAHRQHKNKNSLVFPSMFFIGWILIWEHSDHRYKFQIFRSIVINDFYCHFILLQ